MDLLSLLVLLIVACVLVWGARTIMSAFGIGDPIASVVYVVIVILILFELLGLLGHGPGLVFIRR